jgi:hypothetical protein
MRRFVAVLLLSCCAVFAPKIGAEDKVVHHTWKCETTLKKVAKKGNVCAVDEAAAINLCGTEICELDLICSSACKCADTAKVCTP